MSNTAQLIEADNAVANRDRVNSNPRLSLVESAAKGAERTSGELLARNTVWNLVGFATPMLVAVLVIPFLIRDLGTAKYGVLTIAWGIVGYFGVFDMGLSNALTKLVAERVGEDSQEEINDLFHTGFLMLAGSSIVGGLLLAAISRPLAYSWLNVLPALRHETFIVFLIFSAALPFVVSAACFRGTLSAYQRFDLVNKVQIACGVFTFAGPAAVLPFSHNLVPIVIVLALSRVFAWLAYLFFCIKIMPSVGLLPRWNRESVRPLITFGGWISVSNVTDPLFLYSDRFLLGAMVSMSAVAYYATPFDMVVRLWMIPDALNTAFFPAYAASLRSDGRQATQLLERAGNYLFPVILAPVLLIVLFSRPILTMWIGASFAFHSADVLAWLAVGVFLSSIARIPWTLLIAHRPDLPAKLVLVEAPVYLAILYLSIRLMGLEGAAMAWAFRTAFNCVVLHVITWRILPESHRAVKKNGALLAMASIVLTIAGLVPPQLATRGLYFAITYAGVLCLAWFYLLSPEERSAMTPASYFV